MSMEDSSGISPPNQSTMASQLQFQAEQTHSHHNPTDEKATTFSNVETADDGDNDDMISPFEWLTSPCSLKPLIISQALIPNSFISYGGDSTANAGGGGGKGGEENEIRGRALHVGSGSSTLGEFLAEDLGFGLVVNVDKDVETLTKMERRWNRILQKRTQQTKQQHQPSKDGGGDEGGTSSKNTGIGQVHFVPLDFNDTAFSTGTPALVQNMDASTLPEPTKSDDSNSKPSSSLSVDSRQHRPWTYPDESFDLVLDKSTLDCTLCSDKATASLLGWVYRSLAPGGVYLLISFHAMDLLLPLLADLPGAQWEVTTTTMHRHVEPILGIEKKKNKKKAAAQQSRPQQQQHPQQQQQEHQKHQPMHPATNIWAAALDTTAALPTALPPAATPSPPPTVLDASSSLNQMDLKKPLNVLIARKKKRPTPMTPTGHHNHILQHDLLVQHIHHVNHIWFQKHKPLVTKQREETLLQGFQTASSLLTTRSVSAVPTMIGLGNNEHVVATAAAMDVAAVAPAIAASPLAVNVASMASCPPTNPLAQSAPSIATMAGSSSSSSNKNNNSDQPMLLGLPDAYQILFTPAEREHLTYPHFLEDWQAFLEMPEHSHLPRDCISCETAVAFLKEMQ